MRTALVTARCRRQRGQAMVEYMLLMFLMSTGIVMSAMTMGGGVAHGFHSVQAGFRGYQANGLRNFTITWTGSAVSPLAWAGPGPWPGTITGSVTNWTVDDEVDSQGNIVCVFNPASDGHNLSSYPTC